MGIVLAHAQGPALDTLTVLHKVGLVEQLAVLLECLFFSKNVLESY